MKSIGAIVLATVMAWRASILRWLVSQDTEEDGQAQRQGEQKPGPPKQVVEFISGPIVGFVGLTTKYEIAPLYWKLALVARLFEADSLFVLRQRLDQADDGPQWLDWLGVQHGHELLNLPPLSLPGKWFILVPAPVR